MEIRVLERLYRVIALAAIASLGFGCGGGAGEGDGRDSRSSRAAPRESATRATHAAIPLLAPFSPQSVERDMPPAVRDRILGEQRALLAQAREAARLPATAEAGCEPSGIQGAGLGPPSPEVEPRILGHHVEVEFSYGSMPSSAACRPAILDVVVYSGEKASPSFNNAGGVGRYLLRGRRGRVVLDVPWSGRPPYHVLVNSTTADGRRGPSVERLLSCPGTGDPVRVCLPGYRPAAHDWPMPEPVLPLRGVERESLEASLRYVLAGERSAPVTRGARCPSLLLCEVT